MNWYYDKNTIKKTDENTMLVWIKNTFQDDAEFKAWIEATELREVDCNRRRYKILSGKRIYENEPMEIKNESAWIYFEPDDLDSAFTKIVCEE